MRKGHISNKVLADAFIEKGESVSIVCYRMGWMELQRRQSRKKEEYKPESARFLRAIGLEPDSSHGKRTYRTLVRESVALEIARAMNLDPVDIGL